MVLPIIIFLKKSSTVNKIGRANDMASLLFLKQQCFQDELNLLHTLFYMYHMLTIKTVFWSNANCKVEKKNCLKIISMTLIRDVDNNINL